MKKMKAILMYAAILTSVSSEIAKSQDPYCQQQTQFYKMETPWGYYFVPAGQLGIDYVCLYSPFSTCTYFILPGTNYYYSCQSGQFWPVCNY